jgi:hypothetical protein
MGLSWARILLPSPSLDFFSGATGSEVALSDVVPGIIIVSVIVGFDLSFFVFVFSVYHLLLGCGYPTSSSTSIPAAAYGLVHFFGFGHCILYKVVWKTATMNE